jgi:hypothetical protein
MPRRGLDRHTSGVGLPNDSVNPPGSSVADGIEFEETFPEAHAEPTSTGGPAPAAAPRLSVVRPEPAADPSESHFEDHLGRRLREAEELVKQTIESVRLGEEKRLTEWMQARRDEEERRLARWADERRVTIERSIEPRAPRNDAVAPRVERRATRDDAVSRIEELLREWQERFEQRLDQRRNEDARIAERQRISDEERLRAWRTELELALTRQFSIGERAVAHARAESSPLAAAIASAASARDVSRIIHGALSEMTHTLAFALSLHQEGREDVAYRYHVANDDELGALLRRDPLDDGAQSAAAHADGWVRAQRVVRVAARNATVYTTQLTIKAGGRSIGVLTLQTEATPIADGVLPRIAELVQLAAPRLAALRDAGSFRGA